MNGKSNAAPGVSDTQGGGWSEMTVNSSSVPNCNFTAKTANCQPKIADFLPRGEQNAVPTSILVRHFGFRSARSLQTAIQAERESGLIILSRSSGGYFLPSDGPEGRKEIERYCQTLRARALNTLRTLKSARQALREVEGQMALSSTKEVGQ